MSAAQVQAVLCPNTHFASNNHFILYGAFFKPAPLSLLQVWQTIVRKSAQALIVLDFESDLAQLQEVYNTMSVSSAQASRL